MGLLAVVDTFLLYKIVERRYNKTIALIASILFAVMPLTWLLRRILLEPIQLPFILSSILFAMSRHAQTSRDEAKNNNNNPILSIILSGVFLGLAIFTKIPAFTMIPLIAYLVYTFDGKRNRKVLELWLIPVIVIPAIWPVYAIIVGDYAYWLDGITYQMHRQTGESSLFSVENPLIQITSDSLFPMDPVLLVLGLAGIVFAAIRRDSFILLWSVPYLIFLYFIGYVSYFHFIILIPVFSIGVPTMAVNLSKRIMNKKIAGIIPYTVIIITGTFGLLSISILITADVSGQYEAAAFILNYLHEHRNEDKNITIVSSPVYSWIFDRVFDIPHVFSGFRDIIFYPVKAEDLLLIADSHFRSDMRSAQQLQTLYDNTTRIAEFKRDNPSFITQDYPYTSIAA